MERYAAVGPAIVSAASKLKPLATHNTTSSIINWSSSVVWSGRTRKGIYIMVVVTSQHASILHFLIASSSLAASSDLLLL